MKRYIYFIIKPFYIPSLFHGEAYLKIRPFSFFDTRLLCLPLSIFSQNLNLIHLIDLKIMKEQLSQIGVSRCSKTENLMTLYFHNMPPKGITRYKMCIFLIHINFAGKWYLQRYKLIMVTGEICPHCFYFW